ncbi:alpha/beta hydrolase [Draconibacterium mangrovi]|uniref:alpha/beta hydrolase n=1 Tax=Draconibacterium mangrovi TaxID=2697469 RepID=UPI0013D3739D|nr:alpha/beta hydrolase-fold protein [Draconibacterium mangrovi]
MKPGTNKSWPKQFLLIALVGLLLQPAFKAQSQNFVLKNTETVQLKNELTGRDHELIIFLPDSYNHSKSKKYPVFYFLDGYWHMPLLYSIYGNLRYDNVIPEMIMVGLSYPGENVNYDSLRMRDLTPTKWYEFNQNTGDGPGFLQFIEKSVIPTIESNYRADKSIRALGGQSAGGLFSLYAMYSKPELFKRYIAISPAAMWGQNYLFLTDSAYSKLTNELPVRLFLSAGGDEYPAFRAPIIRLQKQIESHHYQNFSLLNYVIEGERHTGVAAEGYTRGLRWIFKDMAPTGPSGLAKAFGVTE